MESQKAGSNIHRSRYPDLSPSPSSPTDIPLKGPLPPLLLPLPALLIFERTAELCEFGNNKPARFSGASAPEHLGEHFPSPSCRSSASLTHNSWVYSQSRARCGLGEGVPPSLIAGPPSVLCSIPFVPSPWSPCFCCLFRRSIGYRLSVSLTRSVRQPGRTPHTITIVERRAHYLKFGSLLDKRHRSSCPSPLLEIFLGLSAPSQLKGQITPTCIKCPFRVFPSYIESVSITYTANSR